MEEKYLMAIDAGTGSVRAVLFHTDGTQASCVQQEWEHKEDPYTHQVQFKEKTPPPRIGRTVQIYLQECRL